MSLAPGTRCTFVILALSTWPDQFQCQANGNGSRDSLLAESQMRILSLTLLGLFVLTLLGLAGEFKRLPFPRSTRRAEFPISDFLWAGCICCFCRISRAVESTSDGLDVYAPRTQSIVWPTLPQEAARVLEMTFLHASKVNCLCRNCCIARNSFCIENCGVNKARWILLLATSVSCAHLAKADDNFTDFGWLNVTQLLQMAEFENENNTAGNATELDLATLADSSTVAPTEANISMYSTSGQRELPFEELHQHRHFGRFVFMVLLLHISVVGVGITIYSCVHCRFRSLRKRSRVEAQRRLQLTDLRSEHIPNSRDCPCHGCILAREMLQGLIMHQLHELAEC
ncbi:LOW QUALITY PROTEIN: uncharacterized protein LOC6548388 [Drosophila erecta]|uniref:LOW QUALITY PROTEIN: uncharacterized protein LOC6548388 n=1 Tax=Drosophila erecta TaxID=7220 RepID=UPI000F05E2C0|nr:LOW QUALITY PROTEIN: uncharacterized protein LOC6548388 [Drosophila erecta]